ncbi:helix-turn-helix domain-containing protein [Micromonospora sp. NBC_01813]|uniref:helix-turn-helix domain-containing protein n=1 Tax=Micromonospora sp. NBC_01813 TaxID=2975988 RepID=UPI002DDA86DA|nr:helix-turn-helix transcriptional regulator [Micromonospora sp. NBC_01813]WSA09107.1 helix-turn-helix transcriptional regulator [Micromonospora sp. NBC_01813]
MSGSEYLVGELRRLRNLVGLTQGAWGERIHFSASHVGAVERGERPVLPDYLRAVDRVFGTALVKFYREFVVGELAPMWLRSWLEYEERASALRVYQPLIVPGLLQTEDYARMVLSSGGLLADEVERQVQLRLGRQLALTSETPPRVVAILDEQALRRGEAEVMAAQLEHLISLAQRPTITIRVVPADAPPHLGWGGPVDIASFDDEEDVGYLDNHLQGQVATGPGPMTMLQAVWDSVSAVALPAHQSVALMKEVTKTWTS